MAEGTSDEALFERYRAGDNGALRTLIERYHGELLRFLYRLVGDQAGAEDVFQEAFLQVHLSAASFDATRRFRPWLFTIAANKGRDYLRRKGRRRTLELSAPVGGGKSGDDGETFIDLLEMDIAQPDARMDSEEMNRKVQRAVDMLSPTLREILLLAYFSRLSYAQIADELEIPLGTVKSRLHAAVASFAKAWQQVQAESKPE
ncbi:MAG TPA: sigma-70 family RNA polymerase sigma factor [Phycisphaerales bacterium]|nr:sigma-70 family RNA polymerase sigma factor [Phycisphaerales bacterium]